ncbi:MAG: ABC transporter permease [Ornithinimicrobium sp.]|jgi:ABC-2 type transport system permease protein|uniref:ABC transporter permease n=1 Tax=Ornithinimicrobium sp. TaxID=1977084 RepID=UPI0017F7ACA5|nr:ABC transporter permease [Actinomycetota bacterium]
MNRIRAALAIAAVELRRFLRDRSNIFFVFIFPLALVMVLGLQFGGQGPAGRVAVAGEENTLRASIAAQLEGDDVAVAYTDLDGMREQVARGRTDVGLVISSDQAAAFDEGQDVQVQMIPSSQAAAQTTVQLVRSAVREATTYQGQVAALSGRGASQAQIETALARAAEEVSPPTLQVRGGEVDELAQEFAGLGQFDLGASSQLLLFVFLSSLAGSVTLIQARRRGIIARSVAAPVSIGQVLVGQGLGRLAIALFQGLYIMLATAVLFDVNWGTPALTVLVLLIFSTVSAGAAMLLGSLIDNEGAASGLGVGAGLVLAALGGGMMPLEIFPDTLRTVAHVTPHAWAYDALADIQRRDAGLVDILGPLAVLVGMALALVLVGTWALRRSLARAM